MIEARISTGCSGPRPWMWSRLRISAIASGTGSTDPRVGAAWRVAACSLSVWPQVFGPLSIPTSRRTLARHWPVNNLGRRWARHRESPSHSKSLPLRPFARRIQRSSWSLCARAGPMSASCSFIVTGRSVRTRRISASPPRLLNHQLKWRRRYGTNSGNETHCDGRGRNLFDDQPNPFDGPWAVRAASPQVFSSPALPARARIGW